MSGPDEPPRLFDPDGLPVHPYADGRVPRVAGSDTSAAAADSIEPNLRTKQAIVLGLIRAAGAGGMTNDEVQIATGWLHQTVTARRCELEHAGLVADSGRRRPTRTGRMAAVIVALEHART